MDVFYKQEEIKLGRGIAKWEEVYKGAFIVIVALTACTDSDGLARVTYADLEKYTYMSKETLRKILRT